MEQQDKPVHLTEEFAFGPLETHLNLSLHAVLCSVFISLAVLVANEEHGPAFKCHCIFTLLAFLILSQAILTVSDNNILTQKLNVFQRILMHWTFSTVATVTMIIGFICSFFFESHPDNLASSHSQWGLATVIGMVFSAVLGVWMRLWLPWLDEFDIRPVVWRLWHSIIGVVSYFLAYVAICSGLVSHLESGIAVFLIILLTMTATYVLIKPIALIVKKAYGLFIV